MILQVFPNSSKKKPRHVSGIGRRAFLPSNGPAFVHLGELPSGAPMVASADVLTARSVDGLTQELRVFLYVIHGEASGNSGGGLRSIVVAMPRQIPPCPNDALEAAYPGESFYCIDEIRLLGSVANKRSVLCDPAGWDEVAAAAKGVAA